MFLYPLNLDFSREIKMFSYNKIYHKDPEKRKHETSKISCFLDGVIKSSVC